MRAFHARGDLVMNKTNPGEFAVFRGSPGFCWDALNKPHPQEAARISNDWK